MISKKIKNFTRTLGKHQGFKSLSIWDINLVSESGEDSIPAMVSAWEPTPSELDRLNKGAFVLLTVMGRSHPPVRVDVDDPPEEK